MSLVLVASVVKISKNCYPKVFLEECKYTVKEKNMSNFINDELEMSSDESDEEFLWFWWCVKVSLYSFGFLIASCEANLKRFVIASYIVNFLIGWREHVSCRL